MKSQLEQWLSSPITIKYIKVLKQHRDALLERMLNSGTLTTDKLPELAQIKGQINALDLMLNTDELEFQLNEEIEEDGSQI